MYLWKTDALATELKQGTLNQRERFKYLFLTVFFYSLYEVYCQMAPNMFEFEPSSTLDIVIGISYSLIFLIILYFCYQINRTGDDQDFIARFTCLLIPLYFRLIAIIFPLMLLPFIMAGIIDNFSEISEIYIDMYFEVTSILVMIWVSWRLLYWFRWISHRTTP